MMRRRQLIRVFVGALAVGVFRRVLPVRAQSADDTEQPPFILEYDGQTLAASRDFEATGLRPGALTFDFTVLDFEREKDAKAAFVEIGDQLEDTEVLFGLLVVRDGQRVHVWGAIGLGDPYVELAAVAEAVFARDLETPVPAEGTPQATANLLALLPELDDLPAGFTMAEEKVRRPGDDD